MTTERELDNALIAALAALDERAPYMSGEVYMQEKAAIWAAWDAGCEAIKQ